MIERYPDLGVCVAGAEVPLIRSTGAGLDLYLGLRVINLYFGFCWNVLESQSLQRVTVVRNKVKIAAETSCDPCNCGGGTINT